MPKKLESLDSLDIKILAGLTKYGPRNLTKIARKLRIHPETMRPRIKRMSSLFYLRLITNVYHTNLGLKKAVVFADATPGYEELLFKCMGVNGFWHYLSRYYGMVEGCLGIYTVPKEHVTELEQFIQEIKNLGLAEDIQVFWSTCFHTVNPTGKWFDLQSEAWVFPWDKWIKEIPAKGTELPYTLVDPKVFPMRADETDLYIIKELEIDATVSLTTIAKKLGLTLQGIRYHYQKHVIERGIVECFRIFILPYDRAISDMFYFVFKFDSREKMAKFALSLLDKPFVYIVGKILGENALIAQIYLPRLEFRRFVDALSKLGRNGLLQRYKYVIQDLRLGRWFRQTIPYELYKDTSWRYGHKEYIKKLRDLVENVSISEIV